MERYSEGRRGKRGGRRGCLLDFEIGFAGRA